MNHPIVSSPEEVTENIIAYQREVSRHSHLSARMKQVHAWYAHRTDTGEWLFAPSKFVGYRANTAAAYRSGTQDRHGGKTEVTLRKWFEVVSAESRRGAELHAALNAFVGGYGHDSSRNDARICIARGAMTPRTQSLRILATDRIAVDPAICGGRPHIRGTRVRVADVLDMLAAGATAGEIVEDYPYLAPEDVAAALAYAAATADHRIVEAA
jgi:uncharacterized protein (DUF433 family)